MTYHRFATLCPHAWQIHVLPANQNLACSRLPVVGDERKKRESEFFLSLAFIFYFFTPSQLPRAYPEANENLKFWQSNFKFYPPIWAGKQYRSATCSGILSFAVLKIRMNDKKSIEEFLSDIDCDLRTPERVKSSLKRQTTSTQQFQAKPWIKSEISCTKKWSPRGAQAILNADEYRVPETSVASLPSSR